MEYASLVSHPVRLNLVRGGSGPPFVEGNLFTVDPVSGDLVLAIFDDENQSTTNINRMLWVPNDSFTSVEQLTTPSTSCRSPDENLRKLFDSMFMGERCQKMSPKEVDARKKALIAWFKNNHVEVRQDGDSLLFFGSVRVLPPFQPTDAHCDNPVVLKRIRTMIEKFPQN